MCFFICWKCVPRGQVSGTVQVAPGEVSSSFPVRNKSLPKAVRACASKSWTTLRSYLKGNGSGTLMIHSCGQESIHHKNPFSLVFAGIYSATIPRNKQRGTIVTSTHFLTMEVPTHVQVYLSLTTSAPVSPVETFLTQVWLPLFSILL